MKLWEGKKKMCNNEKKTECYWTEEKKTCKITAEE